MGGAEGGKGLRIGCQGKQVRGPEGRRMSGNPQLPGVGLRVRGTSRKSQRFWKVGGSQDAMWVASAKIPNSREREPVTSSRQTGSPVEG